MKQILLASLCLFIAVLANNAGGTVYYWDPEGTTSETAADLVGTWNTSSAQWSISSAQTGTPAAWVSGYAADFCAGSTTVTTPFTVTVNSSISIGGIFNGSLSTPGAFVTLNGSGSLFLVAGADAFATGGGGTTINVPMTGPGQVALEASAKIYFNATNTYSGGTSLGYPGLTAFTSTVLFNNGSAFGTGAITMTAAGAGCAMAVEGSSAITVTNPFIATSVNLNVTGNVAGLTLSGPWNLAATPMIGAGGTGNLITISGVMSGAGGFTKYGASTLVLSGANTYSGGTTISNGALSVTADNNLGAAPSTANYNVTLSGGTLNASNTFTLNSNRLTQLTANSSISVASGKTLTCPGAITGSAALTKTGAGTLALSGANGYTGTTTISGGTLEADSQTGSAVGANSVTIQAGTTLSGSGVVSGTVSGAGNVSPGTPAGPATLTLGNGLNLSSGGIYVWNLSSNSTSGSFSTISLIGGNLQLGGTSKLSLNFNGAASTPNTNDPFWLTQEEWTVVSVNGSGVNANLTQFTSVLNGSYAAGNFTNYAYGGGSVAILYQPNFPVFDTLYDYGSGFNGGENLILTNFSGLNLYVWSAADASLSVSNWTLVGKMGEQQLAPALPGYSRYSINVSPTVSPICYIAGNINNGPYIISPVPTIIITTPDFSDYTVINTNVAINTNGVLTLQPASPVILPGGIYSGGQFQFQFSADTNQNYIIQASSDLVSWTNISSGTVSNSPMTFIDPAATNNSYEFYRVVLPWFQ